MSNLIDRLNRELETFGRRAQAALDEGKLQIELLRLKRMQDTAARDLGLLYHRRERGLDIDAGRLDSLMRRLDDLERDIKTQESRIAAARGRANTVHEEPAPASATPADAEVGPTAQ